MYDVSLWATASIGVASWVSGFIIGKLLRKSRVRHYTVTHRQGSRYQIDWNSLGNALKYDPVMLTCGGCGLTVYAPDGFTPEPHGCTAIDMKINVGKNELPLASETNASKVVPLSGVD